MMDSHMWLSVFVRPERGAFSRAQRLSCCVSTLFLTMIVSAMFYGTMENVESPFVITVSNNIFTDAPKHTEKTLFKTLKMIKAFGKIVKTRFFTLIGFVSLLFFSSWDQ